MRKLKLCLFLISALSIGLSAQSIEEQYDFWVGNWELSWTDANGNPGKGKNLIEKRLDGKVIQENFEALEGQLKGYKGTSISVCNPNSKSWHQTWQDNQGGNIVLTGAIDGNKRIFQTKVTTTANGQQATSRMVFYNITKEAFTWDWEGSTDGGKTWKLNWRIQYKRAGN